MIKGQRSEFENAQSLIFNPLIFSASSISKTLVHSSPLPLRILSLHRRVCNLTNAQGDMIALVHPSIGNGPLHIVLAQPVSFATLEAGEPTQWWGNSLQFERFTIDLAQATAWDPALPQAGTSISPEAWNCLREHVRQMDLPDAPDQTDLDAAVTERTQQAADHLLAGLHNARTSDIVRGTELLAGLGVGLTPAGDDFLLGFMARIWLEPTLLPPDWTASDLCQRIAQTAGPRTTCLSRTWLDYAARGQFAEPWHDLVAALALFDQSSIYHATNRILNTGATSGRDALTGCLLVSR